MAAMVQKARKWLQILVFAHKVTTVVLVVAFALSGVVKLTPLLNTGAHAYMGAQFIFFAQVLPFNLLLGPYAFRVLVAITELFFAAALVVGYRRLQHMLVYALLAFLIAAIYVSAMAGDLILSGAAVLLLAVVLVRLYIARKIQVYMVLIGGFPDIKEKGKIIYGKIKAKFAN